MAVVKVKICGITNYEDAAAAVDMGVDLLGFNFYPKSKRYIRPAEAIGIINKLPTFVDIAGLFVNAAVEEIKEVAEECFLNWIQLHGDETSHFDSQGYGGTGKTFDWDLISQVNKRVFLAGGINPDNAVRAVETGVYGIDICSGVEKEPGKKDHKKMRLLFENIRHVRG
jgi:phosphoribosylanthranilate isomerase